MKLKFFKYIPLPNNGKKKITIALCVLAYFVSYLCRTNLSVALDDISVSLAINRGQAGLISTAYFWTYAVGQLLAGWLCVKTNPKHIVIAGLLLTGTCNMLIGFADSYAEVLLLWTLNGLSLALFWPPIFQISTSWCLPEEYVRISILVNLPTTLGFMIAWGGLGYLNSLLSWEWMFRLPAIIAFAFCIIWMLGCDPFPKESSTIVQRGSWQPQNSERAVRQDTHSILRCFLSAGMITYAAIIVAQGCVKESINLWAPTVMNNISNHAAPALISTFTALIPIFSTIGLLATGFLARHTNSGQERAMLTLLLLGTVSGWVMMCLQKNLFSVAICLGLTLAAVYGTNTLLTTFLPLKFAHTGPAGTVSSIFNFLSYLGAALGGFVSGWISDYWGWSSVYLLWAGLLTISLTALIFGVIFQKLRHRK